MIRCYIYLIRWSCFGVDAWSRFWRWNLNKICDRTCDRIWKSYFGKQNSTLGYVVPLAMFWEQILFTLCLCLRPFLCIVFVIAPLKIGDRTRVVIWVASKAWCPLKINILFYCRLPRVPPRGAEMKCNLRLDRSQSLFYFVPQEYPDISFLEYPEYHSLAGSTNLRQQKK